MFTGLSAFPLTPLDDDGAVDEPAFERLVARLADGGRGLDRRARQHRQLRLSQPRRARAGGAARGRARRGGVPVMIGIGAVRTEHVIEHAHDAQEAGAAAVMLAPVSYQALTEDEVFGLYADVTAELSVPLCVYDNPGTTHFTFSDELHARVAALPGVRRDQAAGRGRGRADRACCGRWCRQGVAIGVSGDQFAAGALDAGADVWFSVRRRAVPAGSRWRSSREREPASARLEPLWALFRRHGGVRVVATAAALLGLAGERNLPRPLRLLDGDGARRSSRRRCESWS